jgi:hypothetical protein
MRRVTSFALPIVLILAVAACTTTAPPPGRTPGVSPAGEGRAQEPEQEQGEEEGRGGSTEVEEEAHETQERLEALEEAVAEGRFGTAMPVANHPAAGWSGEQLLNPETDDWEPAVAADPKAPYVYMLTTRYGTPKTCQQHCPTPFIALTVSSDGGATWGAQVPLCVCRGSGAQYDPTIEVVPNTGFVYAVFLNADRHNGFSSVFQKSTDHGKTWTEPVHIYGNVSWTDKPEVTMSRSGRDVYTSWNGPQGGDLYVGVSHDYGGTWSQQKLTTAKRYYFAYDGTVLPNGTVIFSESSLTYSGKTVEGPIWHHAIISRDHGTSWENVVVDKVPNGEPCVAEGCGSDFYTGQTSVTSDPNGHVAFAYEGAEVDQGPQRVFVRTSDDGGRTWGPRTALSVLGENATGPRLASGGPGNVRIWYMQTANADDPDAWNVWYRSSPNGGTTWSAPVKLSDATSGAGYKTADGFLEIYGDYGEIDVTNSGKTIAVWGEGFSWTGPGGTWFSIQT